MSALPWLTGFAPIFSPDITHLILGSFPSEVSLDQQRYYGHPQNQFWRLLGAILDEPLVACEYEERTRRLLLHGIGVWDVYAGCERSGSLDSAIRKGEMNPLARLIEAAPRLTDVGFNGKAAAQAGARHIPPGIGQHVLPSSSPAYTLAFEHKLHLWTAFLRPDPA